MADANDPDGVQGALEHPDLVMARGTSGLTGEKELSTMVPLQSGSIAMALALDLWCVERALVIGFGLMIPIAELVNSAMERIVDRISLEPHPLAKQAKDLASAAVGTAGIAACRGSPALHPRATACGGWSVPVRP